MNLIPVIKNLIRANIQTPDDLVRWKRKIAKDLKLTVLPNHTLLQAYRQFQKSHSRPISPAIINLLRRRKIRTLSGVAVITVLTKPHPCPGHCIYCPTESKMPKSYLASEPAAQRAWLTKFDPYRQTQTRLKTLQNNGHPTDKIELIVLGGTWSAYPKKYQTWFVKRCFDAANGKTSKTLTKAQKINEKTTNRIIGLTIETRPDYINPEEIISLRELGVTRVQIGVQTVDDKILKLVKRGHDTATVAKATQLMKNAGLKINYHIMPGLPGSTPKKDKEVFQTIFNNARFKPDYIKLYPTLVLKNSVLYRWWQQGKYQPYSEKKLLNLIPELKKLVPYWVRIERLIRDIPGPDIAAGSKATNLRQMLEQKGVVCRCIRCREARAKKIEQTQVKLFIEKYQASEGTEYFISYENIARTKLYAFARLRLPDKKIVSDDGHHCLPVLKDSALIRELHTYGQLIPLKKKGRAVQHIGFGKKLMSQAEIIAKQNGFTKIAVISGIGVREYYRKLGYRLQQTYMTKSL